MTLSAVILTKNEERTIANCIDSLAFCDDIIVIDDLSTDRTEEIVKSVKNQSVIFKSRSLDGDFSSQRNFALTIAKGEWVLFVDADESISPELATEIANNVRTPNSTNKGYYIQRKDFLWGKVLKFGETGNARFLRLGKKDSGKWEGKVHEVWKIDGAVGELSHPLIHKPHQTVSEFLGQINMYTTLRAEELYSQKKKTTVFSIFLYPKAKFIKNYFVLKGYQDGTQGFVHAVLMSFHSFLVRAKLYLLWKGIKNT